MLSFSILNYELRLLISEWKDVICDVILWGDTVFVFEGLSALGWR